MSETLMIEQEILRAASEPTDKRVLRELIATEFPDVTVHEVVVDAFVDDLDERGKLNSINSPTGGHQVVAKNTA